jgi:polyisoprenoid-binding protein YceI
MKTLLTPAIRKVSWIAGIALLAAIPVFAQQNNWKIDAEHSTANVFLGSNSDLQNVGVLRVRGHAAYDSADPAESALAITAVLPDGASMSFKSKRSELQADGALRIIGEMTLARTESDPVYNPGEDYYGPVYGKDKVRVVTREVAFVLPPMNNPGREMEVTAEATLGIENYPELFAAVHLAAWQPVIQDWACDAPQAGEDYRGADCTGTLIAPAYRLAAINPGEDYRGDESPVPSGNVMKLVLRLQLNRSSLG